ncbi:MAG: UDP-N-acetylmuramoyl-L-alanyl-D-glutamate--2,6-diaminopimelate ligase [Christensenellales bacterium]
MRLIDLLTGITRYVLHGEKEQEIKGICYDSRKAKEGYLFFCVPGEKVNGHDFAQKAVKNGAVAVVGDHWLPLPEETAQVIVKDVRSAMAVMARDFYGNPAAQMKLFGVTGTNGKTTTTYMIKSIGEAMGKKVGVIGTIQNLVGDEIIPAVHTTPEAPDLQQLFYDMLQKGVDWVAMEVSSHALAQNRVGAIRFDVGIFTNLTQDHLDYHKTVENYRDAKKQLFAMCAKAVLNGDDPAAAYMEGAETVKTFAVVQTADYMAKQIAQSSKGVSFLLVTGGKEYPVSLAIPGEFSVYNALGAAAAAMEMGAGIEAVQKGLFTLPGVNGRIQVIEANEKFTVILDYAHTPDGLHNLLKAVNGFARGRVVTVFGCGGDRDSTKRPLMGEIAGNHSNYCIITSDNPRTEDPQKIIDAIEEGMKKTGCAYICIENRREAIKFALKNAEKDDIIVLAGKGHETYQEIHHVRYPFDEKVVVRELLGE